MLIKTTVIVPEFTTNFYCIKPFGLVRSMARCRATDSYGVLRHQAESTFRCTVSCKGSRASPVVVVLESYRIADVEMPRQLLLGKQFPWPDSVSFA